MQSAQFIDVYEIEQCGATGYELSPLEKGRFQGCRVLRHAKVSDPEERKELIEGLLYSIGSSGNGNACFSPRHGIRASHGGERIELLICFECEIFQGAPSSKAVAFDGSYSENFGGGFSTASQELFERILAAKKRVAK
jgi:hypothetical protein